MYTKVCWGLGWGGKGDRGVFHCTVYVAECGESALRAKKATEAACLLHTSLAHTPKLISSALCARRCPQKLQVKDCLCQQAVADANNTVATNATNGDDDDTAGSFWGGVYYSKPSRSGSRAKSSCVIL